MTEINKLNVVSNICDVLLKRKRNVHINYKYIAINKLIK